MDEETQDLQTTEGAKPITEYNALDALASLDELEDDQTTETKQPAEQATSEEDEELEGTDQESADEELEPEESEDDEELVDPDSQEPESQLTDRILRNVLKDIPEAKRASVERRLADLQKGVEKAVSQAKETEVAARQAEVQYRSWEMALSNPQTAADAIRQLVDATAKSTGISPEDLVGMSASQGAQSTNRAALDPNRLDDWAEWYDSRREMELAIQADRLEQRLNAMEARSNAEAKEREQERTQVQLSRARESWIDANADSINRKLAREYSGYQVDKKAFAQVFSKGDLPKTVSEAVSMLEAAHVRQIAAHVKKQAQAPPKRTELISGKERPGGRNLPNKPGIDIRAADILATID